ncbi:hypothetical protein SAMN05444266_109218 [Chitinophaga jiangningensis]|uniref:Uncharacterized protein n=1 Tax=Chitinophaga jiangningensis TaxID=1419482 RepID=A0A1M7K9Z7_9BACT|nr:hypothetical protein [Chitinophaga jiangningensis]SHM62035.1 hypothetical protein SAMN05444266_109218 [Chitinophaga jiangningensis]
MAVRKTESRIPAGLQPSDLGQALVAPDNRCCMVSFIHSPLVLNRENTYVVFVTDAALAGNISNYEWTFTENASPPSVQTTESGEITYIPQATGDLEVKVRLLDAGATEQASLTISQKIFELNEELETLIAAAKNAAGAVEGNIEVERELINDFNTYYQEVALQNAESGEGFKQFVFSMVYDGALQQPPAARKQRLADLAAAINDGAGDYATLATAGAGVCSIRLSSLAMIVPLGGAKWLPWQELPEDANQRAFADQQLRDDLGKLEEAKRIDLFNIVRFPKSNINFCGHLLEALRDKYFSGTNFSDVLSGMSGTRSHWIMRHYREGPVAHS